ncbi:MAG: dTMP kinase, partial [Bacteroidetes bacterium]|nr:dTMP kinase [Bacteroidota bacterium]
PDVISSINHLSIVAYVPDITFFIDIPVDVAEQRRQQSSIDNLDRIENSNEDFFYRVREGYLKLAEREKRFKVVNGTENVEVIHKIIINEIEKFEER